ncbi:MAG: hypothetical protein MRJ67_15295 [Nitrospirales bacterium]|nr:hypothetical protein [Nitrospirales bacterium]MDR4461860.1 hypothetical protein [Nitrospirales bacterium]MDR4484721.1 hypothetical protein [Nitrospirales bacterium]
MNGTMAISRSHEEGMYLLREGDYVWRVTEDGKVDCAILGDPTACELLTFIQNWKTPSRRIFQEYPFKDFPN